MAWLLRLSLAEAWRFVEMFAGHGNVSRCLRICGYPGVSIDYMYNKHMDINADSGMALLICRLVDALVVPSKYNKKCIVAVCTYGALACAVALHLLCVCHDVRQRLASQGWPWCLCCVCCLEVWASWLLDAAHLSSCV